MSIDINKVAVVSDYDIINFLNSENNEYKEGYIPRNYDEEPFGSVLGAFSTDWYIDPSEWKERIEQLNAVKGQVYHHREVSGFKSLNQKSTSSCWAQCVTQGIHYGRGMQGLEHVPLSPGSVVTPITRGRDRGGWPVNAVKYIKENGIAPQSAWGPNDIGNKYDSDQARIERVKYKIIESYELPPGDYNALISALLLGSPVPIGILSWRHAVLACGLRIQGNDPESDFQLLIDNSWGNWGTDGFGWLDRNKCKPDDAIAIGSVSLS